MPLAAAPQAPKNLDPLDLVLHSSGVVLVVLAMLVVPRLPPMRSVLDPVNAVLLLTALALVAVCGVLAAGSSAFTFWPLRAVGAVSYGFYLWHFPLIAAYAGGVFRPLGTHRAATSVLIAVGALVIAYLSFVFVERPLMRRFKKRLERAHLSAATVRAEADQLPHLADVR